MRRAFALPLAATLLMAGCSREPTFDERYGEAQRRIEERAAQIDRALASDAAAPATLQPATPSAANPPR